MTLSPKAAKTVIIGLISRSVIKPEHVHRLIPAWADSDPTDPESAAFWRQVFEAQGATQALRQNIRNPQMVRLLTLRAILCPDTFPEYLNWLQPSLTSRPKSELQATAEQFLRGLWSLELQQLKDQNPEIAEVLDESRRKALGAVVKAFPNAAPQATSALWAWALPGGFWQIQSQDWNDFFEALQGVPLSPALEKFCLEVGRALPHGRPFYQIAAACRASCRPGGWVEADLYDRAFGRPSQIRGGVLFLGLKIYRKPTLEEEIREVLNKFLGLASKSEFQPIHEFSTGIKWAPNGRGGWVSQGFTGEYMNSTLPKIPYNVQRAIANNLFSVSEGVSTQFPTLVARVVPPMPREEESPWSVLAVVSRGQHDYGRSFSAYRYFLCEGEDKLAAILEFFRQQRQVLTFNPQGRVDQPHPVSLPTRQRRDLSPLLSSPPGGAESPIPVVVQGYPIQFPGTVPGAYDRQSSPTFFPPTPTDSIALINELFKLHNYAESLKNRHPQSDLAWAYNVHSLEKPADFWVIHAASPQVYALLRRIGSQPVSQRRQTITQFRQVSAGVATVLIVGFVWQILSKPSLLGEESITLDLDHCFLPEAEPESPAAGESNQSQASTTEAQPPLQTTLASIFNPEQQTSLGRLLCLAEGSPQWFLYAPSPSEAELSQSILRYQQGLGFDKPDGKIEAGDLTATLLRSDVDFHPYRLVLDTTLNKLFPAKFPVEDTAIRAIATALNRDSDQALTDYDLAVRLDFTTENEPLGESLEEPRRKAQTEWKKSLDAWNSLLNGKLEFSHQNLETVVRTLIQEVQYSTTVEAINLLFNSEQIPGYTDEDEQRLKNTIVKVLGLKAYPLEPDSPDNKKALLDRVEAYNSKDERSQVRMFFSSSPNPATVSSDAATNFEAFKAEVQREFNRSCLRPIQRQFCTSSDPKPPTP